MTGKLCCRNERAEEQSVFRRCPSLLSLTLMSVLLSPLSLQAADNLLFKWLRLWQNEGRISRRLPVTTSSGAGVELLPVEITPDEQKEPVAALTPLLSTPSQSTVSASSCKVEFRHGNMTLENPSPELLTVLIRELTGRGR
ncbi:hypothetical protein [Escherichia coli]|uniref:hypothetical protein n=1 Tax=Escherichia coli TaxID=562 RepID=UPI003855A1BD